MRKKNKQTRLAIKPTTKFKIRFKYWFDYLLGIKSPSREFAKLLEGMSIQKKSSEKHIYAVRKNWNS